MINGNVDEFIDGLHYGDERFFVYNGNKYFIQGFFENEKYFLELYVIEQPDNDFEWKAYDKCKYPVEKFEKAKLFDGKTFWDIEKDIEWVDC